MQNILCSEGRCTKDLLTVSKKISVAFMLKLFLSIESSEVNLNCFPLFLATFAYERMCSAEEYLHSILAVADIQDDIINHLPGLVRILSNNDCNVSLYVMNKITIFN